LAHHSFVTALATKEMANSFGASSAKAKERAVKPGTGNGPDISVDGVGHVHVGVMHTFGKRHVRVDAPRMPAVRHVNADNEINAVPKPPAA